MTAAERLYLALDYHTSITQRFYWDTRKKLGVRVDLLEEAQKLTSAEFQKILESERLDIITNLACWYSPAELSMLADVSKISSIRSLLSLNLSVGEELGAKIRPVLSEMVNTLENRRTVTRIPDER